MRHVNNLSEFFLDCTEKEKLRNFHEVLMELNLRKAKSFHKKFQMFNRDEKSLKVIKRSRIRKMLFWRRLEGQELYDASAIGNYFWRVMLSFPSPALR